MPLDPTEHPPGLSHAQAQERLLAEGHNELPSAKPRSLFGIAWVVLREPMFLLLIACGGVYLLLGSKEDAFILLSAVLIIMLMNFTQERKSERTLEALRELSSPRALVLRDGQTTRIAGRDVVPGDIIMLSEGDRVPADAVLFSGMSMTVDESLLSGESVPVRKQALPVLPTSMATPGGNDQPYLYSGTLVVQGKGKALVIATAKKTALGRIGQALYSAPEEASKVQTETAHAVKVIALSSIALVILLTVWYGVTRNDLIQWKKPFMQRAWPY